MREGAGGRGKEKEKEQEKGEILVMRAPITMVYFRPRSRQLAM